MTRIETKAAQTHFHISLDVQDLAASVAFYGDLLGVAPDKHHATYARFTTDEPALVLSLVARPAGTRRDGPQRVSHLGLRVGSDEALAAARQRLTAAGLPVRETPGSRCCYALQDKFWVTDPDGNEWEYYRLLEDLEMIGEDSKGCCA